MKANSIKSNLNHYTGAELIQSGFGWIALVSIVIISFLIIHIAGITGALLLASLPLMVLFLSYIWRKPKAGIWAAIIMSFLASGLARYMTAPWGLSIDIVLTLSWLAVLLNKNIKFKWKHANNKVVVLSLIWFVYITLELFNPAGNGPVAWFYAMPPSASGNMETNPCSVWVPSSCGVHGSDHVCPPSEERATRIP